MGLCYFKRTSNVLIFKNTFETQFYYLYLLNVILP